jgi:hypothetical protein
MLSPAIAVLVAVSERAKNWKALGRAMGRWLTPGLTGWGAAGRGPFAASLSFICHFKISSLPPRPP